MQCLRAALFRSAQLAVYAPFVDAVAERLRYRYPIETGALGRDQLVERIWKGIDKAVAFGMDTEADAACFIEHLFAISHDMNEESLGAEGLRILRSEGFSSEEKMNLLIQLDFGEPPSRP